MMSDAFVGILLWTGHILVKIRLMEGGDGANVQNILTTKLCGH